MLTRWLNNPKYRNGAAFISGALLLFAYAPFHWGWITPFLLAIFLLLLVRAQSAKQAAWTGFWFGFGWFGTGISWVFVSIDQFGGLPLVASVGLMVLLCAYLALYPALAGWLWFRARTFTAGYHLFLFPLIWLLTEFLRGWVLTGFPWLSVGYTQTDLTLGALAPHIGETGITVLLWVTAIALATLILRRRPEWLAVPLLVYSAGLVSSYINPMQPTGEFKQVALVQGNILQDLKWDSAQEWPNFMTYQDLSRPYYRTHDIIVWPESAITFIEPFAQAPLRDLDHRARSHGTTIISGIIDYRRYTREYFNTIVVFGDQEEPYRDRHRNRYQKHHLLPIGEFVPFENFLRPVAPLFNLPMSSFSRGPRWQPDLTANGVQLAANICYEVAFPRLIRSNMKDDTDVLLTVSNDSWFGDSHGPHQHLQIAQMRAAELGRPMLRATNNGVTAIIDERGRVSNKLPQFEASVLSGTVTLVEGNTWYYRFGNLSAWLLAGLIALISLRRRKAQRA
ncbi:MAG: apolipoprotein N-acyltransferase [Idiomarina sp.]|nr:apolipoprotein N-acyltransferase [Idiomarina sp.]